MQIARWDFRPPVVLDRQFAIGRMFGASGTPSAIAINETGQIDRPVAVGAEEVLRLLGHQTSNPTSGVLSLA